MARRVAVAVGSQWLDLPENDRLYVEALRTRGVGVDVAAWNGEDQQTFFKADLVVLRATWDYYRRPEAFAAWLDALEARGVRLANPYELVRWNLDKRYLDELAKRGALLPLQWLAHSATELNDVFKSNGLAEAAVKPLVGASGHGVQLVAAHGLAGLDVHLPVMVQEFIPEIRTSGQSSLVFFSGELSHAVRLTPQPGEFRINSKFGGVVEALEPDSETVTAASALLSKLPTTPLYARVDGVSTPRGFVLLELELIEPGLFLTFAPGSEGRFADATLAWLR